MSRLRRLTGPLARRLLLAFAVAAAWAGWMIVPPRPLREWTTTSREPLVQVLSPDRTRLACTTGRLPRFIHRGWRTPDYGPVRLWDLATGHERLTVGAGPPSTAPFALRMAPDGSWLLTKRPLAARGQVALQLWDTETGRERWSIPIDDSQWAVDNFGISPDGRFVACRRSHGTADVLHTATGQVHCALGDTWPLAFAADGRTLVTMNPDPATVTLWDVTSGRPRTRLAVKHRHPMAAAVSPDGRWLAVELGENVAGPNAPAVVELWDLHSGERAAELDFGGPVDAGLRGLAFRPDGSLLIAPSTTGSQQLWDVAQSPPRAIDIGGSPPYLSWRTRFVAPPVYPLFTPDGRRFVGPGPGDGTLVFRETAAPDRAVITGRRVGSIDRIEFAPDGRTLAVWHRLSPLLFYSPPPLWRRAANWLSASIGWGWNFPEEDSFELAFFDAATGAVAGRIGGVAEGTQLIGFGPDGRTVWTMTHTPDPPVEDGGSETGDGTLRVQEWAVPSPWPPAWLLAVTALGGLVIVFDWRRNRRLRAVIIGA